MSDDPKPTPAIKVRIVLVMIDSIIVAATIFRIDDRK